MFQKITKAIFPLAGLGTRFLPLSKVIPKELMPIVDKPLLHYSVKEALDSGIEEIIFVLSPEKKKILDYFQPAPKLEKILSQRKKDDSLKEIASIPQFKFQVVYQRNPKGVGDAILKAASLVGDEPCAILFADDLFAGDAPVLSQLLDVFSNYNHSILCLVRMPKEKIESYGVVAPEKIANRLYKIRDMIEKPPQDEAPSDLAITGRYIITPEVFKFLKKIPPNAGKEKFLTDAFLAMLKQGKLIYGYEVRGEWMECGNKLEYLKTFIKLAKSDKRYSKDIMSL